MDISQAFKYLFEASDEELFGYDQVDIVLKVVQRLAKAVSRYRTSTLHPSDASQDSSASLHTADFLRPQCTNFFNKGVLNSSYPSSQDSSTTSSRHIPTEHRSANNVESVPFHQLACYDATSNLYRIQNPVLRNYKDTVSSPNSLLKAIERNISWVWNLRYKSISLIINESKQHPDVTISDILRVEGKDKATQQESLIARTAQRSFGLQYERTKKSRVADIHLGLHSESPEVQKSFISPGRGGQVRDFVKECICPESHPDFDLVVRSTNFGIKELALEHELFYYFPSLNLSSMSILTSMIKDIFNKLSLLDTLAFIGDLYHLHPFTIVDEPSGETLHMHLFYILQGVSLWYEEFQKLYDQHVQARLEEGAQPNAYPFQTRSSTAPYREEYQHPHPWRTANRGELHSASGSVNHFQRLPALTLPGPDFSSVTNENQQICNAPPPTNSGPLAADFDPCPAVPRVSGQHTSPVYAAPSQSSTTGDVVMTQSSMNEAPKSSSNATLLLGPPFPENPSASTQDNSYETSVSDNLVDTSSAENIRGESNQSSSLGDAAMGELDIPLLDFFDTIPNTPILDFFDPILDTPTLDFFQQFQQPENNLLQ